jgi:pimeloyl-ACP methyl ester carboxylesterase
VPPSKTVATPTAPAAPAKTGGNNKLPEPEEIGLETRDGWSLKATYFPGTLKKEAVPVIMVHGIEGQRGDFQQLALYLQSLGHASLAMDLRGHGQSKPRGGGAVDPEKFPRGVLEEMTWDIEAAKSFLKERNDRDELNLAKLCVVGAEFGAILSLRWAALDLTIPDLHSAKKSGDVKALVLLSIPASYKGVSAREALPAVHGKATSEAKKLLKLFEARHAKGADDLKFEQPQTTLAGTKLLGRELGVNRKIGEFIDRLLTSNKSPAMQWEKRKID